MGEICGWHMKAAGTREGIIAFERMLSASSPDGILKDPRPRIRGAAYGTYPDIKAIKDSRNGTCTIEAWGSSRDSLEPMIEGECEDSEILLQEAAKRAGVTVEVFGDAYSGLSGMDFHLIIGPDGTILKNIAMDSIHEWLDSFEDDEELVETVRPVLKEMGITLPVDTDEAREKLNEYIDSDEYIDIRPFEWDFSI